MLTFDPKYSEEQYTKFLLNLCPPGAAFPRRKFTTLYDFFSAFGAELLRSDIRINQLLKEAYPALCDETIDDWYSSYSLPGCFPEPATLNDKIALLIFKLVGISDYYIADGLTETFITNLAADPILDYNVIGFAYYDRLAVGPLDNGFSTTGDTAVGTPDITFVAGAGLMKIGQYISVDKGFTVGELKILNILPSGFTVDRNAISSVIGANIIGFDERPGGMGDGVGENLVNYFDLKVLLPPDGYTSDPGDSVAGSPIITNLIDTSAANVGSYALLNNGWPSDPVQKIISKTANSITVETDAEITDSNVIIKTTTKNNDVLECFFNKIFHSHVNINFVYS